MTHIISKDAKDKGFTLVEVLISLFIFSFISAGTLGAMFQTFAAKERLDAASAELADIALFRAILRADMNAIDLRPMRDGVGGTETFLITTRNPAEQNAVLTFTRLGRSNPAGAPRGQSERVRYLVRDEQFIRQTLIHENPAELGEWSDRVLFEGVENLDVFYRTNTAVGANAAGNQIIEDWTIFNTDAQSTAVTGGAIEFKLTDKRGIETSHLFEIQL